MTCKVGHDFEIITDLSSRVSLVTSNVRGSSIRSPKSLYKKTGNEILAELKAVVKTSALRFLKSPTRPVPVCYGRSVWQACVKQPAFTHTTSPPRGREEKGATKTNFSSCRDHSWIKTTAIFSTLTFEFEYFLFCELLSLQPKRWSYGTLLVQLKLADKSFSRGSIYI